MFGGAFGGRQQPGFSGAFGQPNRQQPSAGGFSPQPPAAKPLSQWAPQSGQASSSPFGAWAAQQPAPQQSSFAGPPANVSMPQFRGRWGAPAKPRSERFYRPPAATPPQATGNPVRLADPSGMQSFGMQELRRQNEARAQERRQYDDQLAGFRQRFPGVPDDMLVEGMTKERAARQQQAMEEFQLAYGTDEARREIEERRMTAGMTPAQRDARWREQNGFVQAPPVAQSRPGMAQPIQQPSSGTPYGYQFGIPQAPQWGAPQGMNRWF